MTTKPARQAARAFCTALATAVFCLAVCAARADDPPREGPPSFLGWIPVQPVTAGERITLDLHRFFFQGTGTDQRFVTGDPVPGKFSVEADMKSFALTVAVDKSASGLIEIPLRAISAPAAPAAPADRSAIGRKDIGAAIGEDKFSGRNTLEGVLVVGVKAPDGYTFTYRSTKAGPVRVTVAGDFNSWNTESHQLKSMGGGNYELFIPVPPGARPYKLIVDGQWTLDPANPEQADDGTGSVNSIARVGIVDRGKPPVVYAREAAPERLDFGLVPGGADIVQISSVLQLPDGQSRIVPHKREGHTVSVDTAGTPDGAWVRVVAADAKGNVSNAARAPVRPLAGFQWQDGVMYYAFTDRFADGEKDNNRPVADERVAPQANYQGGDFQGVRQKIEEGYFKKLGVNVLWLSPLNRNPDGAWQEYLPPYRHYTGYHGYWPVSHNEVEPRFGGDDALQGLVGAAHGEGMSIIADLVLKHVHSDHPMWKEHPELFGPIDLPDGTKNLRQWDAHQFTTWFEEWLPAFDFDKPETVKFLIGNAVDFAKRFKLDGYRLDAVKHIKPSFWWRYRTAMRVAVDAGRKTPIYSVGETFMGREGIMQFVGPNMLDGQFDFPLYDTIIDVFAKRKSGMEELERSLAASEATYGKETLMSPLLGNHDKARFMAYADGDLPDPDESDEEEVGWKKPPQVDNPAAFEKLKMGLTFVLSLDGVPMIYYGDEIGMSGAGDPDNRRMMRWGDDVTPGENSVRVHLSTAAAVRHAHPALRYGSRRALVAEGDRYAFVRAHLGDAVLAVWNRGDHQTQFALAVGPEMRDGTYADALSGQQIEVRDGKTSFKLPPMKSALFVAK